MIKDGHHLTNHKGIHLNDMSKTKIKKFKILLFDIENCPCLGWFWSCGKQRISQGQVLEPNRIICISWKWLGERKIHSAKWDSNQSDKKLLTEFCKVAKTADRLIGHNGKEFDIKHVNARVAFHNLDPLPIITIEDTLKLSRSTFRLPAHNLDYLGKYFGLGKKIKTDIDLWLDIWLKKDNKQLDRMVKYCKQDTLLLEKVYNRIKKYIKTSTNLSILNLDSSICPKCAGALIKYGLRYSTRGCYQEFLCKNCGHRCSNSSNIIKHSALYPK